MARHGKLGPRRYRRGEFKNEAQEVFYRARDRGWAFAQPIAERIAKRTGMTLVEARALLDVVGEEMYKRLLDGHAVGLPYMPVTWIDSKIVAQNIPEGRFAKMRFPILRTRTSKGFRFQLKEAGFVDRGTDREQYDKLVRELTKDKRRRPMGRPPSLPVYNSDGVKVQG